MSGPIAMTMTGSTQIGLDFISKLKEMYSTVNKNDQERLVSELNSLIEFALDRRNSLPKILDRIGRMIAKYFEFKSISIGLRGEDGHYRYAVLIGHPRDAEEALRKQSYSSEDMLDYNRYPNIRLTQTAQFNPVEGFPVDEAEIVSHHHPVLPKRPRSDLGSFLPGDYLDFYMFGFEGRLIGWIEVSETKDGRLPSRETIRWMDLITNISGAIIQPRIRIKEDEDKTE
jgi:hypothetical protein